jgi:hypothetical protein
VVVVVGEMLVVLEVLEWGRGACQLKRDTV